MNKKKDKKKQSLFFRAFASLANDDMFGGQKVTGEAFGKDIKSEDDVPPEMDEIMEYILKHKVNEVGLFRKNGVKDKIGEIIEVLDMGEEFPMEEMKEFCDVHTMAGVFKYYYRELPNPLLTYELYDDWIAAIQEDDQTKRDEMLSICVGKLPVVYKKVLQKLLSFLAEVGKHQAKNKMGTENLALVFAPNLLRPKELDLNSFAHAGDICRLVQDLIEKQESLFSGKKKVKTHKKNVIEM